MTNRYTELASGLCYAQGDGTWADSRAEFAVTRDGGAEALELPHKLHLAPDINSIGAVKMTLPDDQLVSGTPRGLYLYDTSKQKRALLSPITNAIGTIVSANTVVYANCFVGLSADVVIKVTPAGVEQDVAIRESLDWIPLEEIGFNPASTVLEVWTEFYDAPAPAKRKAMIPARKGKAGDLAELEDESLQFGSMAMRPGRAFLRDQGSPYVTLQGANPERGSAPIGKAWREAEGGRRFLVESARWREILPHFKPLQRRAQSQAAILAILRSGTAEIPPPLAPTARVKTLQVAKATPKEDAALILDYATLNGSYSTYVFAPNQTYYISGPVSINDAVFYGGTVIKMALSSSSPCIFINHTANFQTGPGRMVIITGKDDNTVGEWIAGSTGAPQNGTYAAPAIYFNANVIDPTVDYIRISHQVQALYFANTDTINRIRHSQFYRCDSGVVGQVNNVNVYNVLYDNVNHVFEGNSCQFYGEHVTVHDGGFLGYDWGTGCSLTLINSLIVNTPGLQMSYNLPAPTVRFTTEPTPPIFQTAAFGAHYLTSTSPYRGIGNPAIDPELRAALKQKTTWAPVGLPGGSLVNLTLTPQVRRNDGWNPDLGYSYDAIDYLANGLYMQSSATLVLTNGVVVGLDAGAAGWGIRLASATKLISEGTPTNLNRLVELRSMQEQQGGWVYSGFKAIHMEYSGTATPVVQLKFTALDGRAGLDWHIYRNGGFGTVSLNDCQVLGGGISGIFNLTEQNNVNLQNNLFEWSRIDIHAAGTTIFSAHNNTFINGQIDLVALNTQYSGFRDNIFDTMVFTCSPIISNTRNGYYQTPALSGSPPIYVLISPVNYQQGPLGKFYLPNGSSPLLRGGSRTPGQAALYHHTTQVTQEKEGSKLPDGLGETRIDVGFHYISVSRPNLALNKAATQSSTDYGGVASRAVDGNTDGDFTHNSVTHTAYQAEPWWQVDLGVLTNINEILLWNRSDCCSYRLSWFYVFVSDNPFQYNDIASTRTQPGVSAYPFYYEAGRPTTVTIAHQGRYVRVQLMLTDYLSLAEVQVFPSYSPIDTDADFIPDYVEDRNSDGIVNNGETSYTMANTDHDQDAMPTWWEIVYGLNALDPADITGDPDQDFVNNLSEYECLTDPNVKGGYIPNNKNSQNWPNTVPIPPPAVGAPTQEREYKFSFAGVTLVRPNDGVARMLAKRVDNVLINALLPANRGNWAVYAALGPFPTGGDVHNIAQPTSANANYTRTDTPYPTHTSFMDIYFESPNNLCYTYDGEYRMRRRADNTERMYNWIRGNPAPEDLNLNNRVEFMSKVDRIYDLINRPGWSEVTESRNRDFIPWFPAANVQCRINDFQDGRWPNDMVTFNGSPSDLRGLVCNAAWKMRDFVIRTAGVSETDQLMFRPKLVVVQERRRQHFRLPGLKLSFVPGVVLENVFIITVDAVFVYKQDEMLGYMKKEPGRVLPQPVGSYVEIEVEFERDTSDTLDDMINVQPPRLDHDNLVLLRNAFLQDNQKIIDLIKADFNNKPLDLTEFYTIKGAGGLLDLSHHGDVIPVTQGTASGVQTGVQGKIGNGLSFNGNGYVSYVPQALSASATLTVDATASFVLTEFQSRGTALTANGDNRDAIVDENGNRNDWIEILNVTGSQQSLNGWYLTDDAANLTKWAFPNYNIPAGGSVIVFADSSATSPATPPFHANFGINAAGEYLALVKPGGTAIATVYNVPSVPDCDYDVSYGMQQDSTGAWVEGLFNANPGQLKDGIYRRLPMQLGNADFTISLWLKTSAAGVAILSKSDTDGIMQTGEKQLYLDGNGKVRYFGQGAGSIAGTTAVNNNAWHHIAITYTLSGNVRKVYVDGQDNTDVANTDYVATADATAAGVRLLLGYDTSTQATAHLSGTLDDVAIWARALTATEISTINTAGGQGASVNTRGQLPAGLLFHASMDVSLTPQALSKYKQAVNRLP